MIIQNAIKIIEDKKNPKYLVSSRRHDFVSHKFIDGAYIFIDGGRDYFRSNLPYCQSKKWQNYQLTNKSKFSTICNRLLWKTHGKNNEFHEGKYVRLKDCTKSHLREILKTQKQIKYTIYEKVIKFLLKND